MGRDARRSWWERLVETSPDEWARLRALGRRDYVGELLGRGLVSEPVMAGFIFWALDGFSRPLGWLSWEGAAAAVGFGWLLHALRYGLKSREWNRLERKHGSAVALGPDTVR